MQIERKIFWPLLFHYRDIFCEHLIIEIERCLQGSVFIEVPADGNE